MLIVASYGATGSGHQTPAGVPQVGFVSSDAAAYASARLSGARAVKIVTDWSAIEPQRGRFVWTAIDQAVAAATRDGLIPILVVAYTPRWASVGTGPEQTRPDIYSRQPPRDVREWERFVGAAAERYRGRVAEW